MAFRVVDFVMHQRFLLDLNVAIYARIFTHGAIRRPSRLPLPSAGSRDVTWQVFDRKSSSLRRDLSSRSSLLEVPGRGCRRSFVARIRVRTVGLVATSTRPPYIFNVYAQVNIIGGIGEKCFLAGTTRAMRSALLSFYFMFVHFNGHAAKLTVRIKTRAARMFSFWFIILFHLRAPSINLRNRKISIIRLCCSIDTLQSIVMFFHNAPMTTGQKRREERIYCASLIEIFVETVANYVYRKNTQRARRIIRRAGERIKYALPCAWKVLAKL